MATKVPEGMYERMEALRQRFAIGMQGGLGAIQELDLTLPQVMAVFRIHERGTMTVSELQGVIGRSQAATSHLVEQLVQRGLVRRREEPEDRRRRALALTSKGRSAIAKIDAVRRHAIESALSEVPAEALERLDAALSEVLSALSR